MTKIECPFCKNEVVIDISKCIDEEGEVHVCPHCHEYFRWVER